MRHHVIHREIIELTVPDCGLARRITPLASDLIQSRVTPLLERLFDVAVGPGEAIRVDRLELDLGHLNLGSLDEQLPVRIEAALPEALRSARGKVDAVHVPALRRLTDGLGEASSSAPGAAGAAMMLVSQFARTGGLPSWSDARRQRLLDEAVESVARASPASLAATFRALADDDTALERLVIHLSETALERILVALAPGTAALRTGLATLLDATPVLAGMTHERQRLIMWRAVLQAVAAGEASALTEAVLTAIAVSAGTTLTLLLDDLCAVTGASPDLASIQRDIAVLAERHPPLAVRPADDELETLFERLTEHGELSAYDLETLFERLTEHQELSALLARLRPLEVRLPSEGRVAYALALAELARAMTEKLMPANLAALLRPFMRAGLIALTDVKDALAPLARVEAAAAIPANAPPEPKEDEDSRIVSDSGLCLLWPFVPRFFERLGLLDADETEFTGPPQRHRGVLLLRHLATGETKAPDLALALPKVLCGLPLRARHYPHEPVTVTEANEARQLLEAVIAHADCLGDISPDGFRETFLNRAGVLTTRDGAWLLRVERQTTDILLDRFPWTAQWVRLPWMQVPMRVEW